MICTLTLCYLDKKWDLENLSDVTVVETFSLDKLNMVGKLTRTYWLIVILCLLSFSTVNPLINISVGLISSTEFKNLANRQLAMIDSGQYASIPYEEGLVPFLKI